MRAGVAVTYRGEAWVTRGSHAPGKVTIARADNWRVWRVVDLAEVAA